MVLLDVEIGVIPTLLNPLILSPSVEITSDGKKNLNP